MNLERGIRSTIRIIKGIERKISMTLFAIVKTILLSKIPFFLVVTKIMPKITPKNQAIVPETPIMTKVSCRQCKNSPESRLKLGIKVITKFSIILIPPVAHLSF